MLGITELHNAELERYRQKVIELSNDKERLQQTINDLNKELYPYRRNSYIALCVAAQNNRLPPLFKNKRELAMAIAREPLREEFNKTPEYNAACSNFDELEFIFSYTHYDECMNGHYFRRS